MDPHDIPASARRVRIGLIVFTVLLGLLEAVRALVPSVTPGGVATAVVALLVAGVLAVGAARWSNVARFTAGAVAGYLVLGAMLEVILVFARPAGDWLPPVLLSAAACALAVGVLLCAFHRPYTRACQAVSRERELRPR